MRIERITPSRAPSFRLRLTFGGIGASGAVVQQPLVIALPWKSRPQAISSHIVHLDPGERLDDAAIDAVEDAAGAGYSAVVACASLADAVLAFGDLADAAGYAVDAAPLSAGAAA